MDETPAAIPEPLAVESDGLRLAALLYRPPEGAAAGAVLVCHGAGSRKENHADFAGRAVARGLAALTFDFRGHGESEGAADDGAEHDVIAGAHALAAAVGAPWLAARGSSMGAYLALSAAAARPRLFRRIAALCPADETAMLAGLDRLERQLAARDPGALAFGRWDLAAVRRYYGGRDLAAEVGGLGGVLVVHARDDESVPFAAGERLYRRLAGPRRLLAVESGGHTGIQHDAALQEVTLDWIVDVGLVVPGQTRRAAP